MMEERCRRVNVEVGSSRGLEQRCRACRCGSVVVGNPGAPEAGCRRSNAEVWGYGALEARYRCIGVEVWRSGGGLPAGLHRGMKVLSAGVAL